jgi:hypothetical protein
MKKLGNLRNQGRATENTNSQPFTSITVKPNIPKQSMHRHALSPILMLTHKLYRYNHHRRPPTGILLAPVRPPPR